MKRANLLFGECKAPRTFRLEEVRVVNMFMSVYYNIVHIHTYIHTYIRMYIHTYIYIHTHWKLHGNLCIHLNKLHATLSLSLSLHVHKISNVFKKPQSRALEEIIYRYVLSYTYAYMRVYETRKVVMYVHIHVHICVYMKSEM
jgi:hypothetical protein